MYIYLFLIVVCKTLSRHFMSEKFATQQAYYLTFVVPFNTTTFSPPIFFCRLIPFLQRSLSNLLYFPSRSLLSLILWATVPYQSWYMTQHGSHLTQYFLMWWIIVFQETFLIKFNFNYRYYRFCSTQSLDQAPQVNLTND